MKKFNWKNIWINTRLILIVLIMIGLYSFTSNRNDQRKIKKIEVSFDGDTDYFVSHEMVNKLLIEKFRDPKSIRKVDLDLNKLEKTVNANEMIQESEVFLTVDGVLKTVVKQRVPIGRLFEDSYSSYVDIEGNMMPLSNLFTARVPVVIGEIKPENKAGLNQILKVIYQDEFLKKNIIGVEILPNGDLLMKNRNHNFDIVFGKVINYQRKFDNYKAFYQKMSKDSLMDHYKSINLKFTKQVVCTKN